MYCSLILIYGHMDNLWDHNLHFHKITCCTGSMQVSEESCTHDMTAGHSTNRFSQVLIIHSTHGCCDNHESIWTKFKTETGPFSLKTNAVPTELKDKLTFY